MTGAHVGTRRDLIRSLDPTAPFLAVDEAGHGVALAAPPVVARALDAWLHPA